MPGKPKRAGPTFLLHTLTGRRRLRVSLFPDGRVWSVQRLTYYPGPFGGGSYAWTYIWHNYGHVPTDRTEVYKQLTLCGVKYPLAFLQGKHVIISKVAD